MNGNFPVVYEPGNLTAIGHDKDGAVLASFTRLTPAPGGVKSLKLSIDAPSPLTGTGSGSYSYSRGRAVYAMLATVNLCC